MDKKRIIYDYLMEDNVPSDLSFRGIQRYWVEESRRSWYIISKKICYSLTKFIAMVKLIYMPFEVFGQTL